MELWILFGSIVTLLMIGTTVAFCLGVAMATMKADRLYQATRELEQIVMKVVSAFIVPLLGYVGLTVFAIAAADRALRAVHEVRSTLNPRLQPLGIVVNRVRSNIGEHRYRVEELTSLFGPLVLTQQIPERTAVQRAQGRGARCAFEIETSGWSPNTR